MFGILFSPALFADDELDKLRSSYNEAVARATAPLKTTYEKELRKLLQRYTQSGRIEEAALVLQEIQNTEANFGRSTQQQAVPTITTSYSPAVVERHFVNRVWKTPTGTKFFFEKAGRGKRVFGNDETPIVWRNNSNGLIEATGESTKGGSMRTWYFRFISDTEAYYSESENQLGSRMQKE
jgi:hypothetical protein